MGRRTGVVSGYSSVSTVSTAPTHYLTGDNSRERIYATIYPRLTTKSNTYTVHMRVQNSRKSAGHQCHRVDRGYPTRY